MSAPPQSPSGYKLCPQCRQIYPAQVDLCPRDQARLIVERRILVGKYILQSRIGAGPRSEVYAAEQPQLGRMVTIKLLRCEPAELDHFDTEVRSIGNIKHEHVVTLYDSGRAEDGRPYIAMEHLEGEDLARHLDRNGPLASERAFILWRQTVSAIAAAHRRNIVHGDLKPRNLFLTHKESAEGPIEIVKVTDFAIGKSALLSLTDDSTVRGAENTRYAAPERLHTGEATLRTDVYSLGMLLLEMLNGSLELGGDAEVSRVSHIRQLVQRQQRVKTNGRRVLSQELEDLLGSVLHKDPARRPADAGALLQLIRQLPEGAFTAVAAGDRASEKAPLGMNSTKPEWPTKLRPERQRSDEAAPSAEEPPPHYVANETPQMGVAMLSDLLKQVKARDPGAAIPEPAPEPPAPPRSRPGLRIAAILVLGLGGAAGLLSFFSRVPVLTAGRALAPVPQVADLGSPRPTAASDLVAAAPLDLTAAPPDLAVALAAAPPDAAGEAAPADPREIKVRFVYSEEDAVNSIECGQESQLLLNQSDKRNPGVEAAIRPGGSCRATGPRTSKTYKYESLVGKHADASGFRRIRVRLSNDEGEDSPAPASRKTPAPKPPTPATPLPRPPGPELDNNGS
ncbi:MAG TPA: serine/threonine-protein kinase [Pseudomonadota bacterium]|nr:serine/threonine-protein kinase [Pseudomonadota bacterium]